MPQIIILCDYRGAFYSSTTNARGLCSMNVEKLAVRFRERGFTPVVMTFSDVDFREDWKDRLVLYQSAEDPGLHYKSFIEDIVLGLSLAGARAIPSFPMLRAHHNKVFMEILRGQSHIPGAHTLNSKIYGTLEEFQRHKHTYPCVIKAAYGAASRGVRLLENAAQAERVVKSISFSPDFINFFKEIAKRLFRKTHVNYSLYRNKFVIQDFLPGLTHDYKLLMYGNRVFSVRRAVRANDFRASGSGRFTWVTELPDKLLDLVWDLKNAFDLPHGSFDIADNNGEYHLLEVQFVTFGPLALEKSQHHWKKNGNRWEMIRGKVELEDVFSESIVQYIQGKKWA